MISFKRQQHPVDVGRGGDFLAQLDQPLLGQRLAADGAEQDGVVQGNGQETGHLLEHLQIVLAEFSPLFVHRLQHAEHPLLEQHRHAQDGLGLKENFTVDHARVARIVL